VWKV